MLDGQDEKGNFRIPLPKGAGNLVIESVMIISMISVAAVFCLFNSFATFALGSVAN
jgi:hypothetical protein